MKYIMIALFFFSSSILTTDKTSIYDFSIEKLNSDEVINLSEFKGKKILFVNVASKCGFTYQYDGLQALQEKYQDDLVVIGFPCNQFLWQESGSEDKIAAFCSAKYSVTFPMTTKIDVKGKKQHEIYQWLTNETLNKKGDYKVSWNFNKFLVDEEGKLIEYFASDVKPMDEKITSYFE